MYRGVQKRNPERRGNQSGPFRKVPESAERVSLMETILQVNNLKKYFATPNGTLHAVDDITFSIQKGKTLGVVGESGCGKSTLGRTLLGLLEPTAGEIRFAGQNITHASPKQRFEMRKSMQMIFQDPFASLNPRMCVYETLAEPLQIYGLCKSKAEIDEQVAKVMDTVGIAQRLRFSYPHELDGGRRQRIGIGRALALNPQFVVCDEPVSALDVSIQAQILNLMMDLQEQKNLTYIFITHNLLVVKHISDEILVMYMGCMVEKADAKALFKNPMHPYTKGLLAAIPIPSIDVKREDVIMTGEVTSPVNPKPGCRFAVRCQYAKESCFKESPEFVEIEPDHFVACHFCKEING